MLMIFISKIVRRENCPRFQNRHQFSPHDRETHSSLYPAWSGDIMLNGVFAELVARQQLDS